MRCPRGPGAPGGSVLAWLKTRACLARAVAAAQKKGSKKKKDKSVLLDDAQKRRERITLVLFFVGGTAIVFGMILLSKFLSKPDPIDAIQEDKVSLYGFAAFGILTTVGLIYQKLTKKRTA